MKIIKTGNGELYIKKRGRLYLVVGHRLMEVKLLPPEEANT